MKKPYCKYTKLRHQIIDSGYTQVKFCELVGMTEVSLSRTLHGQQDLSFESIYKICKELDCGIEDIMEVKRI